MNWLAVFIGGGIGSILRYAVSKWTISWNNEYPYGTLISNALASILLALLVFIFYKNSKSDSFFMLLLTVGLCGGFSTFSTFSLETVNLMKNGQLGLVALHILFNVAICFGLVWMVYRLSE